MSSYPVYSPATLHSVAMDSATASWTAWVREEIVWLLLFFFLIFISVNDLYQDNLHNPFNPSTQSFLWIN